MRPTPESVVKLASKIVDLKRQLAEAQREWDEMFPDEGVPSSATLTAPAAIQKKKVRSRGGVLKNSDMGRMLALINRSPNVDFHPTQLAREMSISLDSVRSNLSRLLKNGMIERRGARGFYGALKTRTIGEFLAMAP